ncbi:MAG: CAP domain-containing protein [Blastococcus sp.]
MHHSPTPAPLSERLARVLDRTVRFRRPGLRHRSGRLALGALVSTVLTALVLSVPMVSGAVGGTPFVALDSFAATSAATTAHDTSPVVMGRDGRPVSSSTLAGRSTATSEAGRSSTDGFAGSATTAPTAPTAPTTTDAAPAAPAAPAARATSPAAPEPAQASESAATPLVEKSGPATTAAPAPADPSTEDQVLALVNVQRAAAGCGALTADPALADVARAHSADMRDRGFFDHVNPDGLDPFERAARAGLEAHAENIAYGQPDPAAVMESWMTSAGHRANILNCDLTRLGVGVAQGAGGPWWTQLFA